ncbi:MAG TPA: flagellar assembly protein FliH [Peptococcaceae bacterium]|nr:flagellar assembly protein FliH [Peptococcaceae bacterium]
MKLSTRRAVLKNTAIEIASPRLLAWAYPKKDQNQPQSCPASSLFAVPEQVIEAETKLAEAQEEAAKILAEARRKAEALLEAAQKEREELRKKLEAEVREEIIPQARAEGLQKGLQEAEAQADKIKKQAKQYLELAEKVYQKELAKVDRELVNLCLQISAKIIHTSLKFDPTIVLNILRNLTLLPKEKEGLKIHLSLSDYEWYQRLPAEDRLPYQVIVDEALKPGDSYLECAEGVFEAGIQAQLDLLGEKLLEELKNGELEGSSRQG